MELSKELIKNIDELLTKMFDGGTEPIHEYNTDHKTRLREKAKQICKALNLIRIQSNANYELDEKGILVIQDGGIENYLNNLRLDKDLERTVKELTKKSLKNQFWYNIAYVSLGGLIGVITAIVSVLVQPDNSEKYIQELHKTVKLKADNDDSFQTGIQQMRSEIIFLRKQVDSLKTAKP